MEEHTNQHGRAAREFRSASKLLALLLSCLTTLVLLGWFTGYRELANWGAPPTTKPLLASCLMALALVQLGSHRLPRPAIVVTSAFVAGIGLTVLFQYSTGTDIALLDFMAPSGALPDPGSSHFRMTVSSATCLLLAGAATALGPGPVSTAARFAVGAIIVMIVLLAAGALSPEVRWPPTPTFFAMLLLAGTLISGSLEKGEPLSFNAAFSLMLACAFFPALLLAWHQASSIANERHAAFLSQARENAEHAADLLERFFSERAALLKALSASPGLQSSDLGSFFKHADRLVGLIGGEIVLIDKSTDKILGAAGSIGPASPPIIGSGTDISAYDVQIGFASDLYIDALNGTPSIAVFVPVPDQSFVLCLTSTTEWLSNQLRLAAPPGWTFTIVDPRGTVAASSRNTEQWVGKSAPASLRQRINSMASGHIHSEKGDGGTGLIHIVQRPQGWMAAAVNEAAKPNEQIRSPLASLAIAAAAMTGLIVLIVWMGNRVLAVPLQTLATTIRQSGGREFPAGQPSLIRELNEFASAFHDGATARKAQEQALLERRHIEALGRLTTGVAHDFTNILTIVDANLELVQLRTNDADVNRCIDEANRATRMGARLNRRLMTFAQRRNFVREAVDLNEFVRSALDLINSAVGGSIAVETDLAASSTTVLVDLSDIENSIINLAINARDAMPRGGRLTISTSNVIVDEVAAKERGIKTGDYVQLSVTDTGGGMPDEVRSRAFEPFFTTKVGQVAGLGLATVHGFVKQSGGDVTIQSAVGAGTTVTILLPITVGVIANEFRNPSFGTGPLT